ncbi:enteropeptidase-like [Ptychodera flava]|uniref:enteropeptidase-like n=1 Tax=Ptychodera flava TaxID=63121 RepID=UPI003969D570
MSPSNTNHIIRSEFIVILFFTVSIHASLYLDDHCGSTIVSEGDRVYSQYSKYYENNMDCRVVFKTPHAYQRITLDFAWIDVDNYLGYCNDYIAIYDTNGAQIRKFCGAGEPADIYAIGRNITLRMVTDGSRVDNGFGLVFTSYHMEYDKSCETRNGSAEYLCRNGRCISSSLKCDGLNNCNDGSEESGCASDTVWIVLGVIFGVIILGIVALSIWYCLDSKKKKKRAERNRNQVQEVVTPESQNNFPPAYSADGAYPQNYGQAVPMTTYPTTNYAVQPPPYSES